MTDFDDIRKKAEAEAKGEEAFRAAGATIIPHRTGANGVPQRRAGFYLIDGKDYPSVTTILKVIDKPALIRWAAKQGAKAVLLDPVKYDTPEAAAGAIYELGGEKATERGRDAHKVAELYAVAYMEGTADGFTSDNPYFPAIKAFFDTMRPEIHHIEVVLANTKYEYAGTADLVAQVGKRVFVVDWKTSKFVYDEYPLQLEAYRRCDLTIMKDGTRIEGQDQIAEGAAVVLLRDNGTFQWTETNGDFEAFLAAKRLWLWKQSLNDD